MTTNERDRMSDHDAAALEIAQAFHKRYEELAPVFGYRTSAKPWDEVPEESRALVGAVVISLLDDGVVAVPGPEGGSEGLRDVLYNAREFIESVTGWNGQQEDREEMLDELDGVR